MNDERKGIRAIRLWDMFETAASAAFIAVLFFDLDGFPAMIAVSGIALWGFASILRVCRSE